MLVELSLACVIFMRGVLVPPLRQGTGIGRSFEELGL